MTSGTVGWDLKLLQRLFQHSVLMEIKGGFEECQLFMSANADSPESPASYSCLRVNMLKNFTKVYPFIPE